ncbi:putative toxin-antitoxin system toxin component, PIN family [Gammaproteobacteria bacterium]|nr:putative toxin-antitoxin system toxin component, PIN family [Gammaproteobacteria bacterium]
MRIFLDTNVLASALTTRGLCAELFEVVLQSHDLLISEAVFRELQRILPEKLGQTEAITNGFIALLRTEGQVITAEHPLPKLPDPDDEAILAAALAGNANVFVTGDKALLNLESVDGLPIITPRGLWESLADK